MNQEYIISCKESFKLAYLELLEILNDDIFFSGDFNLKNYEIIDSEKEMLNLYTAQYTQPKKEIYISYPDMYTDVPFDIDIRNYDLFEDDRDSYDIIVETLDYYEDMLNNNISEFSRKNDFTAYEDFILTDFINFYSYMTLPVWTKGIQKSLFLDKQMEVYKHGGFPCCWKGLYPNGTLSVFLPKKEKHL